MMYRSLRNSIFYFHLAANPRKWHHNELSCASQTCCDKMCCDDSLRKSEISLFRFQLRRCNEEIFSGLAGPHHLPFGNHKAQRHIETKKFLFAEFDSTLRNAILLFLLLSLRVESLISVAISSPDIQMKVNLMGNGTGMNEPRRKQFRTKKKSQRRVTSAMSKNGIRKKIEDF